MKKVSSQGNINNQKYEALANMSQFYTAIQFAEPSKETYQWKEKEYTMIVKHEGNKKLQEKKIDRSNGELHKRILGIVAENRKVTTHEYTPGLRIGASIDKEYLFIYIL